uniref:Uncharacterized protein n=1 Tax=Oryza sativa subsp. japonica TaxID=39947 RepID=Q6Z2G2_ORYSJ|nr:hypothetical protein [Oryza sativa Japonica Group]
MTTSNVDSGAPGRGILVLQDFDEMGLRDGFSDNKLLDDFAVGKSNPTGHACCGAHTSHPYMLIMDTEKSSDRLQKLIKIYLAYIYRWLRNSYDWSSTGSVAVLVPRLKMIEGHLLTGSQPVDRSDLSHICFKWSSYGYCLVLDQRCSVSPTTSTFNG